MRTPLQENGQMVYGLHIRNERHAMLTKRVMTLAVLAAILAIVQHVYTYVRTSSVIGGASSVVFMLISIGCVVVIPCCGYFGAKKSDSNLTCAFCGCSCLAGCCNIVGALFLLLGWQGAKWLVSQCEPGAYLSDQCDQMKWNQMCTTLDEGYTARECWHYWNVTLISHLNTGFVAFIIFCIPSVTCQCLSFCWGKELYDVLKEGQVIHYAPTMAPTVGVPVQPVQYVQPLQPMAVPVQPVQNVQSAQMGVPVQPGQNVQAAQAMQFSQGP